MQDRFKFRFWDTVNKEMIETAYLFELLNNTRYIPMQCTGMKDKNGKLIYEGDIIKQSQGIDKVTKNVVEFFNGRFCVKGKKDNTYSLEPKDFRYPIKRDCKILGNIYEKKIRNK